MFFSLLLSLALRLKISRGNLSFSTERNNMAAICLCEITAIGQQITVQMAVCQKFHALALPIPYVTLKTAFQLFYAFFTCPTSLQSESQIPTLFPFCPSPC